VERKRDVPVNERIDDLFVHLNVRVLLGDGLNGFTEETISDGEDV